MFKQFFKYLKTLSFRNLMYTSPTGGVQVENPNKFAEDSHQLARLRARREGNLNNWIAENMYQKTHDDLKAYTRDGVAMDSIAMDADDIKAAYSLSAGNLPQVLFSWFVQQGFIGYQACSVIAQHWLVENACRIPGIDAIKNGYDLTVNSGEDVDLELIAELRQLDKEFKLNQNLVEFIKFQRVFGIRIALFVVESNDPEYYLKPFNIDGVTPNSYKGISQVDPYWITPELDDDAIGDPASVDFYEPTWWRISGKRYHKSHLIITRHADVSDVLKPSYIYGGVPLTQKIYERVYAAERTANEAPQLAMTKRLNVVKTDLEAVVGNQAAFEERLAALNQIRDNYGIYALDADDEFQQVDTTLTDMDALIMTQYQIVASIAGMPSTKLLGTTPKGFNATGEYEQETYYDLLETIQNEDTALLERHYQLLIKSELQKDLFDFEIVWKPLKSKTPKEISEINQANSITDQNLLNTGAIDALEIRDRIIEDKDSGYNGIERAEYQDDPQEYNDPDPEDIGGGDVPESEISDVSLNGAQVSSMVTIAGQIASGELSRESGLEILTVAFPLDRKQAERIIGKPDA